MSVYFYSGIIYKSGSVIRPFSGICDADNATEAYEGARKTQFDVMQADGIYVSDEYRILINQFNKVE